MFSATRFEVNPPGRPVCGHYTSTWKKVPKRMWHARYGRPRPYIRFGNCSKRPNFFIISNFFFFMIFFPLLIHSVLQCTTVMTLNTEKKTIKVITNVLLSSYVYLRVIRQKHFDFPGTSALLLVPSPRIPLVPRRWSPSTVCFACSRTGHGERCAHYYGNGPDERETYRSA